MKKHLAALATVVLVATAVSATASAQPQNRQITQGNLIAALNNVNVQIQELRALNNLTIQDIRVVNVEDVLNNNRVLNNSRFLNNIDILRNSLNNCTVVSCITLQNFLNDNNIAITDVVAINVLSGGDVVVFRDS